VIITALSGVGVALSVGVVCAPLFELNIAAEASTASAVNRVLVAPIVIPFLPFLRTSARWKMRMAMIGAGKTSVNGEIVASGIRRKCVVGHQAVAT